MWSCFTDVSRNRTWGEQSLQEAVTTSRVGGTNGPHLGLLEAGDSEDQIPLLGVPKRLKSGSQRDLCIPISIAAFFTIAKYETWNMKIECQLSEAGTGAMGSYRTLGTVLPFYKMAELSDGEDGRATPWNLWIPLGCPVEMVKIVHFMLLASYHNLKTKKRLTIPSLQWCGVPETLFILLRSMQMVQPLWETIRHCLGRLHMHLPCNPTIPALGIYPPRCASQGTSW